MTKRLIDKRVGEIKVVAIEGNPLNYALDDDGKIYDLCDVVTIVKEQDQRIQELEEELYATRKNRDKLIKKYNNKIKKLKRDKHIIFSTINRFVNKYDEKAEVIRFKKPNTPDDYINQGRLRMLEDLMNVLESHEIQKE